MGGSPVCGQYAGRGRRLQRRPPNPTHRQACFAACVRRSESLWLSSLCGRATGLSCILASHACLHPRCYASCCVVPKALRYKGPARALQAPTGRRRSPFGLIGPASMHAVLGTAVRNEAATAKLGLLQQTPGAK